MTYNIHFLLIESKRKPKKKILGIKFAKNLCSVVINTIYTKVIIVNKKDNININFEFIIIRFLISKTFILIIKCWLFDSLVLKYKLKKMAFKQKSSSYNSTS